MSDKTPLPFDPISQAGRLWREHFGASGPMELVTSVMRAQQIVLAGVDAVLKPHGLSFARYEALVLLRFSRRQSLPMAKMGERLMIHPTSVTNIVDGLEAGGHVRRLPDPADRRRTLVEITASGKDLAAVTTEALMTVDFGLPPLDPADAGELTRLLGSLRLAAGDFEPPR